MILLNLPKILVIESDPKAQKEIQDTFDGIIEIIPAYSIRQAYRLFLTHQDLHSIVVNICVPGFCVPGFRPNTQRLIKKMRNTFRGIIVSVSSLSLYRLIPNTSVGSDYRCSKTKVVGRILELLER